MEENNKIEELITKDIASRLIYGVCGIVEDYVWDGDYGIDGEQTEVRVDIPVKVILITADGDIGVQSISEEWEDFIDNADYWYDPYNVNCFKPYLRSLSSMTETEKNELRSLCTIIELMSDYDDCHHYGVGIIDKHYNGAFSFEKQIDTKAIDWLLKNHFDINGLIEMGRAIEVTEENNPYKN